MKGRILLVEDDFALRLAVSSSLRAAGHDVTTVASAEEARLAVRAAPPDVALLDWMLPGESGIALLASWRGAGAAFPVILLTARDAVADRVRGLEAGANDYVVKPFATEELLARVLVQLRGRAPRAEGAGASAALTLSSGASIDLARETVTRGGETHRLTSQETAALAYLAARPGKPVPRADLLREVWGYPRAVETRSVDNTIFRLRAKIEPDPAAPRHVITVHGVGYRFEP